MERSEQNFQTEDKDSIRKALRAQMAKEWKEGMPQIKAMAESGEFDPRKMDPFAEEDYLAAIKKYFGDTGVLKDKKYLDLGVGFGSRLHDLMSKLGANIISADISEDALKFMAEKTKESGVATDLFSLPIKDNSLDGILCSNVINSSALGGIEESREHHNQNLRETFQQIHRAIKPGGIFMQSHFGKAGIGPEEQLNILREAGFIYIMPIEGKSENFKQYKQWEELFERKADALAFIAKKEAAKET